MKLSISLPEDMAREIKEIAKKSERNVSWWLQKAWSLSRTRLLRGDKHREAQNRALKKLASLQGALKEDFPGEDSVSLSRRAFQPKK